MPNPYGLYDMMGNAWEWSCSAYNKEYDGSESRCVAPDSASRRVLRGGSWNNLPSWVRSADRSGGNRDNRNDYIGFRLLQD